MAFAIIKTGGADIGRVRSVHRGFHTAMKARPATYYGLVNIASRSVKAGEIHPNLVALMDMQDAARREGRAVTGHEMPYLPKRRR